MEEQHELDDADGLQPEEPPSDLFGQPQKESLPEHASFVDEHFTSSRRHVLPGHVSSDEEEGESEMQRVDLSEISQPLDGQAEALQEILQQKQNLFKTCYLLSVCSPKLDSRIAIVRRRLGRSSTANMFRCVSPIEAALAKHWFQALLLLMGGTYLCRSLYAGLAISSVGLQTFSAYRFTPLRLRNGADGRFESPHVSSFGVLWDGCHQRGSASYTMGNGSFVVQYPHKVEMNGFYLITETNASSSLDPVSFVVEGSIDGTSWAKTVGASTWRVTDFADIRFLGGFYDTTVARGKEEMFDMRAQWEWISGWVVAEFTFGLGMLWSAICGVRLKEEKGKMVFQVSWLVLSFFRLASAVGYMLGGQYRESFVWWMYMLWSLGIPVSLTFWERSFIAVLTWSGIFLCAFRVLDDYVIFSDPGGFRASPPYLGALMILVGGVFFVYRRILLSASHRFIEQDRELLERVWRVFLRRGENEEYLTALHQLVRKVEEGINPERPPRHLNRKLGGGLKQKKPRRDSMILGSNQANVIHRSRSIPGVINPKAPVTNLNQLYAQAAIVDLEVRAKVQAWAGRSDGYFKLKPSPLEPTKHESKEYVRWRDALADPSLRARIQWGATKDVDRSIEKLLMVYRADMSRLVDVCRERILFASVLDLHRCLTLISEDSQIEICRIKNWLDPEYNGHMTAGFRAVIINFRCMTNQCKALAIETHVCELQLLLQDMDRIRDDEMHQRYIQFRNFWPFERTYQRPTSWFRTLFQRRASKKSGNRTEVHSWTSPDSGEKLVISVDKRKEAVPVKRMRSSVVEMDALLLTANAAPSALFDEDALYQSQFIHTTDRAEGTLDQSLVKVDEAMARVSASSVFFTTKAAVAAVSKRGWRIFLGLVASLYLFRASTVMHRIFDNSYSYRAYRFVALELRGGGDLGLTGIGSFGLLLDKCKIEIDGTERASDSQLRFAQEKVVNGWYFMTGNASVEHDPIRFELQASNVEDHWDVVGSSTWRMQASGHRTFLNGHFETGTERGAMHEFDLRVPWAWVVAFPVMQLVAVIFTYIFILMGALGLSKHANRVLSAGFTLSAFLQVVAAGGYRLDGNNREFIYWLFFSFSSAVMAAVLAIREQVFILALTLSGTYLCLLDVIKNLVIFNDPYGLFLSPPFTGLFFLAIGVCAHIFHQWSLTRSRRLINEDQQKYDTLWSACLKKDGFEDGIFELQQRVATMRPRNKLLARQFDRIECPISSFTWSEFRELAAACGVQLDSILQSAARGIQRLPSHTVYGVEGLSTPVSGKGNASLVRTPSASPIVRGSLARTPSASPLVRGSIGRTPSTSIRNTAAVMPLPRNPSDEPPRVGEPLSSPLGHTGSSHVRDPLSSPLGRTASSQTALSASASDRRGPVPSESDSPHSPSFKRAGSNASFKKLKPKELYHSLKRAFSDLSMDDVADTHSPVKSLDQLFAQAFGIDPILRYKVQQWALVSNGMFRMRKFIHDNHPLEPPAFTKWEDAVKDSSRKHRILWGKVKGRQRAIEKVLRSYHGDPSCCLDLCRQSVVFENIHDLMRCLDAVDQDEEVAVLRIKNRLDPNYDSRHSAGYRDLTINVRVSNHMTRSLGLDTHVCEVQLQVLEFSQIKIQSGHQRYKVFRNMRGE